MRANPLIFLDQGNIKAYLYLNLFDLKLSWYLLGGVLALTIVWFLYAWTIHAFTRINLKTCLYEDAKTYVPCYFFLLNLLSFRYALYKPGYMLPSIIFIFILLRKYRFLKEWGSQRVGEIGKWGNGEMGNSPTFHVVVVPILIFFFSLGFYLSLSAKILSPLHVLVGDEPSYLMITDSLSKDGDVILNNNYREKAYLRFFPGEYPRYANIGKNGGLYPRHGVGLPFLLVPFYRLGDWLDHMVFFPRSCMNLLTALLVVNLYLLAYEMSKNFKGSLVTALLFGFTTPVLFFSYQIYPEVPAGLILLYAFRKWRLLDQKPLWYPTLIGLAIALLPWFGTKYIILSLALFLLTGFSLIRYRSNFSYWSSFLFLLPIFLSGVLHAAFIYSMYETFLPTAFYTGPASFTQEKTGLAYIFDNLEFKIKRGLAGILGVFLDQRIGLLFHSPLYFFSLAGMVALWKKKTFRAEVLALLSIFLSYLFFYTYNPIAGWGGYSVMNRPVISVIWVLGVFMLFGLITYQHRLAIALRNGFFVVSFLLVILYLKEPLLLYHQMAYRYSELRSNLLYSFSSAFLDLTPLFPAIMNVDKSPGVTLFWVGVTAGLLMLCCYKSDESVREKGQEQIPFSPSRPSHFSTHPLVPAAFCLVFIIGSTVSFKEVIHKARKSVEYDALFAKNFTENGLTGKYYDNDVWGGMPQVIRQDSSLDFLFTKSKDMFRIKGEDLPLPLNLPSFSVEWSGCFKVPSTGNYTFEAMLAPRAFFYLFIDGNQVAVDGQTLKELTQGDHSIRVRFKQMKPRNSQLTLYWTPPNSSKEVIPAEAFGSCRK